MAVLMHCFHAEFVGTSRKTGSQTVRLPGLETVTFRQRSTVPPAWLSVGLTGEQTKLQTQKPQIDANLSDSSPNLPSCLSSSPPTFPSLPFKSPRSLSISHFRPEGRQAVRLVPLHPPSPSSWDPVISTSEALECALVSSSHDSHCLPPHPHSDCGICFSNGSLACSLQVCPKGPHYSPTQ